MSVWLALWIVISATLLGFLVWSLYILYQQKSSWKKFAETHKLRYKQNALMESPEVDGSFEDYKLSFFTGEHINADLRGVRKLTAVEISLQSVMPIEGGAASGGMVPFLKELGFKSEIQPDHEQWNKSYIVAGSHYHVLKAYFTDERVEALSKLMKIKNSWVIFIFRNERMLLRLDTPNPLASVQNMDKVASMMVKVAKVLELSADEAKKLKAEEARSVSKESSLALDDSDIDASSSIELEEDEGVAVAEQAGEIAGEDSAVEEEKAGPDKKEAAKKKSSKKKS